VKLFTGEYNYVSAEVSALVKTVIIEYGLYGHLHEFLCSSRKQDAKCFLQEKSFAINWFAKLRPTCDE